MAMTVCFVDADCGICTAMAAWAERVAPPGSLRMRPNTDRDALPPGVTSEVTDRTIVVIAPSGAVYMRARAVAAVLRALPAGRWVAWLLIIPGLRQVFDRLYDFVSARRSEISRRLGMTACRVGSGRGAP